MVRLQREDGGLLILRFHQPYGTEDEADYLARLDDIASMPSPFVLMTIFGGGPALSRAGERQQALWFKRSRAGMEAACRACAIVRPNASEEMAQVFRRLWAFPILATASEDEARRFLASHAQNLVAPAFHPTESLKS